MGIVGEGNIIKNCEIGGGGEIYNYNNLYGCRIGEDCKITSYVEIQKGVEIGNKCKIEPYVFIPTGVYIGDKVFIGPHVCFTNDKYPKSTNEDGELKEEFNLEETYIEDNVSIGANATILPGIRIGEGAMIAAGVTVKRDVDVGEKYYG